MSANDEIDLAALYGRKLTAEQWNALRQEVLQRAQAARTQALRDVADAIRSTAAQLATALEQHHAHKALARNWHLIAGYKLTLDTADAQTVKTMARTANTELQKLKAALG